jgi:hypothetical protein
LFKLPIVPHRDNGSLGVKNILCIILLHEQCFLVFILLFIEWR